MNLNKVYIYKKKQKLDSWKKLSPERWSLKKKNNKEIYFKDLKKLKFYLI